MVVLGKFFGNNIDLRNITYEKFKKETIFIKNKTKDFIFNTNNFYLFKIKVKNSTIKNYIRKGIIVRKINGENSNIINKINSKFSIVVDLIHSRGTIKYETIGKAKNFYHFVKITSEKKSNSKIKIILLNEKRIVSITKIIIPKKSFMSFSSVEKIFINKENAILTSLPILIVKNNSSKAYHSSKTIKLSNEQIFYLKSKGINNISKLILESLIS